VNIKKAMAEKRIANQKALAAKADLSLSTVARIFGGKAKPEAATVATLMKTLGVTRAYLFGETEQSPPRIETRMDLESEPLIEIMGKVYATPFRLSMQRGLGQFVKGKPGEQDCYALQVEGDSMMPWYIPGELIICRPSTVSLTPYSDDDEAAKYVPYERMAQFNNRDAVVEHEGDTMLKRLYIERTRGPMYNLWMTSTNPKYPKVKVRFGDEWRMHGLVIRTEKPPIPE
jgi:SOS-response transcriptional repressor LexA